jgi:hypothetical protein
MSTAGTLVEDDSPFAHELDPEVVEIARPLVERVAEGIACQVRVPLRGVRERVGVQGREDPAVAPLASAQPMTRSSGAFSSNASQLTSMAA